MCRDIDVGDVTLDMALDLLKWPVELGEHPEGGPVTVHNGPFSFYVQYRTKRVPISKVSHVCWQLQSYELHVQLHCDYLGHCMDVWMHVLMWCVA